MSFNDLSISEFCGALSGSAAVPGGGGAAALVAALGAALGGMVGELTLGKKKYAAVEEDMKALVVKAETLRLKLLDCVDRDAAAFEPLSRAYAIPKDDPSRDETMEACLAAAAAVPMEILEYSCEAIELMRAFAEKGSTLAVSDAGCGAVFCWAAMYAAALNVRVNTRLMRDRDTAERLNGEVSELMEKYWKIADATYEDVYGRLK